LPCFSDNILIGNRIIYHRLLDGFTLRQNASQRPCALDDLWSLSRHLSCCGLALHQTATISTISNLFQTHHVQFNTVEKGFYV
jgi:hypothetical protein